MVTSVTLPLSRTCGHCILVLQASLQGSVANRIQLEGSDSRASSLPHTLKAAHALRCPILVLECVEPAKNSSYVQEHLRCFCASTGFKLQQTVLHLQDIFPCRRSRWWAVLTRPVIGDVIIPNMVDTFAIPKISCLMPQVVPWPAHEEERFLLNDAEHLAFGVTDGDSSYMLKINSKMPCPLHAWGSQLGPCPCGCRQSGLSAERLATKGLFGVDYSVTVGRQSMFAAKDHRGSSHLHN